MVDRIILNQLDHNHRYRFRASDNKNNSQSRCPIKNQRWVCLELINLTFNRKEIEIIIILLITIIAMDRIIIIIITKIIIVNLVGVVAVAAVIVESLWSRLETGILWIIMNHRWWINKTIYLTIKRLMKVKITIKEIIMNKTIQIIKIAHTITIRILIIIMVRLVLLVLISYQ